MKFISALYDSYKNPIYGPFQLILDPKDRKKLEYWNDEKFVKYFETNDDKKSKLKTKKKIKKLKSDRPLVRVLPLIDVLRNNRYTQLKELYVWDIYMDHSDLMCLVRLSILAHFD